MVSAESVTPTALKAAVGISISYASELLNQRREPADPLAVRIWRHTGLKLGRLKGRTDEDVRALAKFHEGDPG